ncbi:ligand-dependent nuclear receptor-interacting factor 1 [Rhinoderma darwinii]|uniref:ligand-dependent nuclear receptor-interacting factor 1 n=1 Tax=Rhinoderma darwinii TaxID=43563 RepID=UPI003F668B8F
MSNLQKLPVRTVPTNQCLTGCLYQVVQATGLQGSNVLKLLPVLKSKDNPVPAVPSPSTPGAPVLNVPQTVISSPQVSIVSRPGAVSVPLAPAPAVGNYFIAAQNNLTNSLHVENPFSVSQEATLFLDNSQLTFPSNSVPGNPTLIMMNTKAAGPAKPTPMLPSGHSLQIPSHAEVITLPVSSLPFSIQQKILPQGNCSDLSKIPSVIYVSPVNTVKSMNKQSSLLLPVPNTPSISSATKSPRQMPPSSGTETPKGPMKWFVQESQESAACIVPVKSSNDTASKILQMMSKTKKEDVNLTNADHSKIVQIKDNALVMCNNKIFFLTKKGSEFLDAGGKNLAPVQPPDKPAALLDPMKDLSNKVVQVVLSKNKAPPPSAKESVQSNVVSTAKPKRKSSTPRAVRGDPVIYIPDDEDCVSVKPADPPMVPASASAATAADKGDSVRKNDQPLPESRETEITTAAKSPELNRMDDRSWRLKFGLLKKEKIIVRKIPLVRAQGPSRSDAGPQKDPSSPVGQDMAVPAETQPHQLKRKSANQQTVKDSKKQKSAEDRDPNPDSATPDVPTNSPSFGFSHNSAPGGRSPPVHLETTEKSSSTRSALHSGEEEPCPADSEDFQIDQDIPGPVSEVSLPSQRFHIETLSSLYPDETTKDEKIQRLKEVLKEREKALEALRRQKKP